MDASLGRAFLPKNRILKMESVLCSFSLGAWIPALEVQRFWGLMASTTAVVQHAQVKMRSLQAWFLSLFSMTHDHPSTLLQVTLELAAQLDCCRLPSSLLVGRPFGFLTPVVQVVADASLTGWGAHLGCHTVHSCWSSMKAGLHINELELLEIPRAF